MGKMDRRDFVGAAALGLVGVLPPQRGGGAGDSRAAAGASKDEPMDVTRTLAAYVVKRETGRSACASPRGGLPDAAELGGLCRRRVPPRDG